jgi:hypothetical protein
VGDLLSEVPPPSTCARCLDHYFDTPFLAEACASVGIEHGRTTGDMLTRYLAQYHQRGHKEEGRG